MTNCFARAVNFSYSPFLINSLLTSELPTPTPTAPASIKSLTLSTFTPPTARSLICESGAFIAFIYLVAPSKHGNILTKSAPALCAFFISVAVYAPGIEYAFTRWPLLEPSFLYGGFPCKDLKHKFLMAQESDVIELTDEVLPEGFQIIPLTGHFFDMVGFRTPDDVVYLADCLSSRETLDKYQIGFIYDVAEYLKTLLN